MYNLYYSPFACSLAVHAALEKINAQYNLTKIDIYKKEHLKPEFLALNPQAQVPVLQIEEVTISQASAILLYLSEQHPTASLMPEPFSKGRTKALQTLFYLSNTVHPQFLALFYPERISQESPEDVKKMGTKKIKKTLTEIDQLLSKQDYLVGDTHYAPDYYMFSMLNWLRLHSIEITELIHLKAYIKRMKNHREIQTILAKEMKSMEP